MDLVVPSFQPPTPQKLHFLSLSIFKKRELAGALCFLPLILFISLTFLNFSHPFQAESFLGNIEFISRVFPTRSSSSWLLCDYSNGKWVWDEDYVLPSYYTEDCPFLDPGFKCRRNGRPDEGFRKWRWKPNGCDLPRFNATDVLNVRRNGRIVFAGDSIGRNQWESLLCMLAQGVTNKSTIYEENGNPITKHKGFLSMKFSEYNLTVEYYREPFLVAIQRPPKNASKKVWGAIRVDMLHWYSNVWVGADVLVFNTGHWWSRDKTIDLGFYFQEGKSVNMSMDVIEALRRSLQTWKSWVINKLDPATNIFFRSYSPVHYRNGTWNDGGSCNTSTAPETDYSHLEPESPLNHFISDVLKQMQLLAHTHTYFLNISYLSELRIDGHPSSHREPGLTPDAPQDCSHWCLPGVPDTWNEILYAHLLSEASKPA